MAKEIDLYDICEGRHLNNTQSTAANADAAEQKPTQRQRVLACICGCGGKGATVEEVANGLSMRYTAVSARCSELKAQGLVRESGEVRATTAGSNAAVLVATTAVQ